MNEIVIEKKLKINSEVLDNIIKFKQDKFLSKEAGGVLIGRQDVNNGIVIIEYATLPLSNDKRSRYEFVRKDKRHLDFYNNLYNNSNIYFYIGEWHTHPENYPNYSTKDKKNWMKIYNENNERRKYYHIILGISEIGIWECSDIIERIK
jgi:integrative and conjugative element protein (TIGR02256 family)